MTASPSPVSRSHDLSEEQVRNWHRSVVVLFVSMGLTYSSLLVRMPEVRAMIGVTTGQLGFILFGFAVGSVTALAVSGRLVERFGTRPLIVAGYSFAAVGTFVQGASVALGSAIGLVIGLLIGGFAIGAADVSSNVDGAAIEQRLQRSIMPRLHAGYSIGTFIGVGLGTMATTIGFSLFWQVASLSVVSGSLVFVVKHWLPSGVGRSAHHPSSEQAKHARRSLWRSREVMWLGLGIFGLTVAEGASNDWLVLAIVDDYGESRTNAGIAYAVLMAAMIATRMFGGGLANRWGRARTLQVLAAVGVLGVLTVMWAGSLWGAYVGAAMWGVGVALAFPLFLSAAGEGEHAALRVSFVATFGYLAFLVGPPVLGVVGQAIGLLNMFWILVGCIVAAAFFASAAGGRPAGDPAQPSH